MTAEGSPRRRRAPLVVLAAIVVAAAALLIVAGLNGTVAYYRTPTEASGSSASVGQPIRLGGQVVPGSLRTADVDTEFRLTDGHTAVTVITPAALPGTFREGEGAVVDGVLQPDGTFLARTVAVKHSNEYRPPAVDGDGTVR